MESLKHYSWLVSGVVAVVIGVAGLSVSDFAWLPVEYQKDVVMLIGIAGIIVKVFVENARVVRAEDLVHEKYAKDTNACITHDDTILNDEYTVVSDDGNK